MSSLDNVYKRAYGPQQLTPPLLFQFVLMRWIGIHKELGELECAADDLQHLDLIALERSLHRLVGTSLSAPTTLPWNISQGVFTILQEACTQLSLTYKEGDKLCEHLQKGIVSCQQVLGCVQHFKEKPHAINLKEITRPLHKSIASMQQFAVAMTRMMPLFKNDENVIFFLLRHASDFDNYYGKAFIRQFLSKMFEGGLKEASRFLTSSYKQRGFAQLAPAIQEKIEGLRG